MNEKTLLLVSSREPNDWFEQVKLPISQINICSELVNRKLMPFIFTL